MKIMLQRFFKRKFGKFFKLCMVKYGEFSIWIQNNSCSENLTVPIPESQTAFLISKTDRKTFYLIGKPNKSKKLNADCFCHPKIFGVNRILNKFPQTVI